jgi:hypothetical protein
MLSDTIKGKQSVQKFKRLKMTVLQQKFDVNCEHKMVNRVVQKHKFKTSKIGCKSTPCDDNNAFLF